MLVTFLNVSQTFQCQSHFSMLVTLPNISHTFQCQSNAPILVTLPNISQTSHYQSHSPMLVTLLNVSYTFQCQSHCFHYFIKARHKNNFFQCLGSCICFCVLCFLVRLQTVMVRLRRKYPPQRQLLSFWDHRRCFQNNSGADNFPSTLGCCIGTGCCCCSGT